MRVHRSSGNVFRDLGFSNDEAENLRVRSELMISLSKLVEESGLSDEALDALFTEARKEASRVRAWSKAAEAVKRSHRVDDAAS